MLNDSVLSGKKENLTNRLVCMFVFFFDEDCLYTRSAVPLEVHTNTAAIHAISVLSAES